jgi:hypothetical protein
MKPFGVTRNNCSIHSQLCERVFTNILPPTMNSQSNNHHAWAQQAPPADPESAEMPSGKDHSDNPTVNILPTKAFQVDPSTTVWKPFPKAPVRWAAQPVLEWVESLAAATEQGEAQNHGCKVAPLSIAGIDLSDESPPRKLPATWKTDNVYHPCPDSGSKRVHATTEQAWSSTAVLAPTSWDLAYVQQGDPVGGNRFCCDVSPLAVRFESLMATPMKTMDPTIPFNPQVYYGIQGLLEFKFGRILDQCPYDSDNGTSFNFGESRKLLNTLYNETIQKMHELVEKSAPTASPNQKYTSTLSVVDYTKAQGFPMKKPAASASASSTVVVPKKDFSKYMTSWLRDNWTNPYPDEDGLVDMARECGTTSTIVSNWLINARTRKWRPAIIKATGLSRPSEILLEDSIRIFDGRPLRPLVGGHNGAGDEDDGDGHDDCRGGDDDDYYRPAKRVKRTNCDY